jgi:succinyl-diaminopimelate desuccinylase
LIAIEKGMMRIAFTGKITDPILHLQAGTAPNAVPAKSVSTILMTAVPTVLPENCIAEAIDKDTVQLTWNGLAAHASTPETGNNAITGLLSLLATNENYTVCRALSALFPHGCTDGSGLGIACADETSGALTCICSQMQIEDGQLSGMIDIRYPLCTTKEAIFQTVQAAFQTARCSCEVVLQNDPHAVDTNSPFVQKLLHVYEEETGEKGECLAIGGGTYVHDIAGGVAFGAEFPGWDYHMHGDDEFIPISHLMQDVRMIAAAILEICG